MAQPRAQNSQEKAYSHVKEQIITLAAKPGTPLRANEIATYLKISRTPVREALSRLEQEGFVMREDGWGYVVRPVSPQDIINLFTIRESLEVQAALEAAPHLTKPMIKSLASNIKKSAQLLKQERYAAFRLLGREFHLAIAAASNNELLYRLLTTIRDRILLVGAMHQDMRPSRAHEVLAENTKLYNALCLKDPVAIKEAVLHHIHSSRASILPTVAGTKAVTATVGRKAITKRVTPRKR
jgi:DNA-binding GntR family transcriptional regulator